jgi:hypothetical protein
MSRIRWRAVVLGLIWAMAGARAAAADHFTSGRETAAKFGVHEVMLTGDGSVANPFDTIVTVQFTPPSGAANARTVWAFYDGENSWRARLYPSETGSWSWSSSCRTDAKLHGRSGSFRCEESKLRGRLLIHPKNPRQWITEDGRWFLNLNDTAYFLLCAHDGRGDPVSDEVARRYVRDDVSRGITSVRCFLGSRGAGYEDTPDQWKQWYFPDGTRDRFRLDKLQNADRRLRLLLDDYPEVAVQLILFPLEGYARDDRYWTALKPPQRERLMRYLVARFAAYPQIFWLITNDAHYGEKFPNNNAMARQVGAFLQKNDPWQHPRSTGHARQLPFAFGAEDWATYVHIEDKHDLGALQYGQYHKFAKPVFLGEDRYEQDHGPRLDPANMRYWQRRLFWAWLFSGGSANYGGRWWSVQPYSEIGTKAVTFKNRPNVTFRTPLTGLDSVKAIRDYFEARKIELSDFEPDHSLASGGDDARDARAPRLMRRGRDEFLVYHPNAAEDGQNAKPDAARKARVQLDLKAATGTFAVEWYRAEDGATHDGGTVEGGAVVELAAPWAGHDVVLRLHRPRAR